MGELVQVQNNFRQEEMRKVSVINKIEKKMWANQHNSIFLQNIHIKKKIIKILFQLKNNILIIEMVSLTHNFFYNTRIW